MRGEIEEIDMCAGDMPLRCCGLPGMLREVDICRAPGIGILLRGIVSKRYGCSRHCRLVSRASGSYLRRSLMQSMSLGGTVRSKSE